VSLTIQPIFVRFVLLSAASVLAACGPSYPAAEYPTEPPAGVSPADDSLIPPPPGALWRRDVNAALDAGLGRFLQHADLEPEVLGGAFVGFRIVELRPPAWWQGIDLVPGDVVTQVNGMPIEQPPEAHAAFESLRSSDKLTVKYLRKAEARELTFSILDKPPPPPTGH
jgi:S1-C subfamily serine protease